MRRVNMARCVQCGKQGLVLFLNKDNICFSCTTNAMKDGLKNKISFINRNRQPTQNKTQCQPIVIPTQVNDDQAANDDACTRLSRGNNNTIDTFCDFPDWYITTSFGKSSSPSYQKAVILAKASPKYHEQMDGGHILHQAVFSATPKDYLAFITLYELVSSWKSSFTLINGKIVDRKVIGNLNYCYGDKCRSGDINFCFGASEFTENPFGCHRLQISRYNNPWWTFGMSSGNSFRIDKSAIKARIDGYANVYHLCPSFNYDNILHVLNTLPDKLSKAEINRLYNTHTQVAEITIPIKSK